MSRVRLRLGWVIYQWASERVRSLGHRGTVALRDRNAAINLAALVKRHVAGSGPET
jgi:hypothetical protein